jgi:hypothetical protein
LASDCTVFWYGPVQSDKRLDCAVRSFQQSPKKATVRTGPDRGQSSLKLSKRLNSWDTWMEEPESNMKKSLSRKFSLVASVVWKMLFISPTTFLPRFSFFDSLFPPTSLCHSFPDSLSSTTDLRKCLRTCFASLCRAVWLS